jgi:hypothetical protein
LIASAEPPPSSCLATAGHCRKAQGVIRHVDCERHRE